jgi:hypothetical protein
MQMGWVKNYRKELKSDVWAMPPMYARVWQYLMLSANFEEKINILITGSGSLQKYRLQL